MVGVLVGRLVGVRLGVKVGVGVLRESVSVKVQLPNEIWIVKLPAR